MADKFEYKTILIKGPQKGVFADFPFDSVNIFGTKKPVRVKVTIEKKIYSMSLLPDGKGGHWLHIKKDIRTVINKEEGDTVKIILEKDNSPKTVEIPEYLQWLLDNDEEISEYFKKLPFSAKKFWIDFIQEPKNDETKVDRINRFFKYLVENYSGKV